PHPPQGGQLVPLNFTAKDLFSFVTAVTARLSSDPPPDPDPVVGVVVVVSSEQPNRNAEAIKPSTKIFFIYFLFLEFQIYKILFYFFII
ncbi:MAG: hypothetical protein ACI9M3_000404, partial [Bacteroidia bacterium]